MLQIKARILYNKKVKDSYFHLALKAPEIAGDCAPGEFLNIKVSDADEPLLRRPLSIHRVKGPDIELLYEVVGRATGILSCRKSGEYLDIIGPLGNGFKLGAKNKKLNMLVAGGMGVAPLLFLAERLAQSGNFPLVLIGAKTRGSVPCEEAFRKTGCEIKIATDDGSRGFRGYVSELLSKVLSAASGGGANIYACGPRPMLKEVSRISKEFDIPAQVSLEEHMACGFGACLGCVVNTKEGFKRVCKEGPVFSADKIIW